ncbi:hypothetical protein MKX01_008221, partial [Papaver californicum]
MHFHDCFVRGWYEVIDDAKTQLEAACPNVVSCADILVIAARDSVVVSGGASWLVPTGRLDGQVSIASETAELPCGTDSRKIEKFDNKRLNTQDLITLVGAHTIGISACQFFQYRLYNFDGTRTVDPTINPSFLTTLQNLYPEDGDASTRVALDTGSKLWNDATTQTFVRRFSGPFRGLSGLRFNVEFGRSTVKMSNIEVKTGTQGEIRRIYTIRIPGLFPPILPGPYNPEIQKCWSTFVDIEGCKAEILNFLSTFHLRLGPACCKAIIDLSKTCMPAVFAWGWGWGGIPSNFAYPNMPGLFPPLLPGPYNSDIAKCCSTLVDIEGCNAEILNFLFTFQLRLGPACCKAIIDLSETCLPAVFSSVWGWGRGIPFNSAYLNVVKGYCVCISSQLLMDFLIVVCPDVVSCAEILSPAARDSLSLSNGPSLPLPTGGRNGRISVASDATNLPGFTDSIDVQIQNFADKGLDIKDLVCLV